ncbi:MAG: hypothetical protein KGH75_01855 [Rhodospirillales bacterium]|nr:hypothetical protein [Rhodospirillales bacterium]
MKSTIMLKSKLVMGLRFFITWLTTMGGLITAKTFINASKPSDGYTALYERGRLDLTVKQLLLNNKDGTRFLQMRQLRKQKNRLDRYGYKSKREKINSQQLDPSHTTRDICSTPDQISVKINQAASQSLFPAFPTKFQKYEIFPEFMELS